VKRDDQTGLAFGGNKTRKLEYLLADAQQKGARTLITAGALQSNHCRQTAAVAARFGLDCILLLTGEQPAQPSGNFLLDRLFGAEIVFTSRPERDERLQAVFQSAFNSGRSPYLIPYGGSNPVGAVAYAAAMDELVQQGFQPDWIVFASSSGGTHAGLEVGARNNGIPAQVLGISIDEPEETLQSRVAALAEETARVLKLDLAFKARDIRVNANYLGGGYGVMGALEKEAIRMFASHEGLLLDPVYTGRAAGGLIDLARKGVFRPGEQVLFWHTGGTPALLAKEYRGVLE
jgi:D-cysteine desulfhydrase family pyridoxal phosphate-dependent enzyme